MAQGIRQSQNWMMAAIALTLIMAIIGTPHMAHGGALDREASRQGPRWSNDHQVPGIAVADDCLPIKPRDRADYVSGQDAWGRSVKPADLPHASPNMPPLTLDIEVDVPRRPDAADPAGQMTARVLIDPSTKPHNAAGGHAQDCAPSVK